MVVFLLLHLEFMMMQSQLNGTMILGSLHHGSGLLVLQLHLLAARLSAGGGVGEEVEVGGILRSNV